MISRYLHETSRSGRLSDSGGNCPAAAEIRSIRAQQQFERSYVLAHAGILSSRMPALPGRGGQ
jgi:hypothetical protein